MIKLENSLNNNSLKIRYILRQYLSKTPNLHNFLIKIHRKYCDLTGFLHVLPDFYILGAAKSGTTALYDYLIQHPNVKPAFTKEINYFDKYYGRGNNWYKTCFPFKSISNTHFLTGEATPRYLDHPNAPNRIKSITPNAKFIILLRNPVDRAFSHYNMQINQKRESLSFEDAINAEPSRTKNEWIKMKKDPNYYSIDYFWYSYLERGMYVKKLKEWFQFFPKSKFLILKTETMNANPDLVYNQVLEFLKLPSFHLSSYHKIRKGNYKKSQIPEETRKNLTEIFRPYNMELYDLIGKNFDWENEHKIL